MINFRVQPIVNTEAESFNKYSPEYPFVLNDGWFFNYFLLDFFINYDAFEFDDFNASSNVLVSEFEDNLVIRDLTGKLIIKKYLYMRSF